MIECSDNQGVWIMEGTLLIHYKLSLPWCTSWLKEQALLHRILMSKTVVTYCVSVNFIIAQLNKSEGLLLRNENVL